MLQTIYNTHYSEIGLMSDDNIIDFEGKKAEKTPLKEIIETDFHGKGDDIFNDDLQKEIVDALNKSIDVPFISESVEARGLNFMYDILEEKVKDALRKAL